MAEVTSGEPFDDAQCFGVRVTECIEPAAVVEAARLDDQRVALPPADRITEPGRLLDDVLPAIEVDQTLRVDPLYKMTSRFGR